MIFISTDFLQKPQHMLVRLLGIARPAFNDEMCAVVE
jgi:hypothetical protein